MTNETHVAIRGYVGAEPTVFTNEGRRSTAFIRVGVTPRIYDRQSGNYSDGTTVWYSVRCYGDLASNVASSIHKGMPVLVRGRLSQRTWKDNGGNERAENSILADSLGIELSTGTAVFNRRTTSRDHNVMGESQSAHSTGGGYAQGTFIYATDTTSSDERTHDDGVVSSENKELVGV